MDVPGTTQDAFFGDIDDLNEVTADDNASIRTLVDGRTSPRMRDDTLDAGTRQIGLRGPAPVRPWRPADVLNSNFDLPTLSQARLPLQDDARWSSTGPAQIDQTFPRWHQNTSWNSSQRTLVPTDHSDRIDALPPQPSHGAPASSSHSYGNPAPAFLSTAPVGAAAESVHFEQGFESVADQLAPQRYDRPYENTAGYVPFAETIPGTVFADYMTDADAQRFADSMPAPPDTEPSGSSAAPGSTEEPFHLAPDDATLNISMSFIDFLPHDVTQPARLVVVTEEDGTFDVNGLDHATLEEKSFLFATGFERNRAGILQNSLETKSRLIAVSFLRFLYTDSYLITADDGAALIATSLLFHIDMYQMGEIYDLPDLKKQAQANLMRLGEFADSYPNPPQDLCEASRFLYAKLSKHVNLIEIVQHYCVNCFRRHNLRDNLPFRRLVDEVPLFGLDLLKTNIERGFRDEGAADIIQLPISTAPRSDQLAAEQQALIDFVYDIWGPQTFATRCGVDSSASSTPSSPRLAGYALVRRPKPKVSNDDSENSASEAEGFTLVHRPRPTKKREAFDSASEADISDSNDGLGSDHEDASPRQRRRLAMQSSVATIRPPPRLRTPTQANPNPPDEDLFDSSDAGFSVVKPRDGGADQPSDSDDFEFL